MTVTRSIEFPMGHRLKNHKGLCRHIHGHNYRVEVAIYRPDLDIQGMVIDFSHLKKILVEVFDPFDHAFVVQRGDPFWVLNRETEGCEKVLEMTYPPTAENLATLWASLLQDVLPDEVRLMEMRVWESSTTSALWTGDV